MEERDEKISLISSLFEYLLKQNPIRNIHWYGDTFDFYWDMGLNDLKFYKALEKGNLMIKNNELSKSC